jgi:hypothetical protein
LIEEVSTQTGLHSQEENGEDLVKNYETLFCITLSVH